MLTTMKKTFLCIQFNIKDDPVLDQEFIHIN